MGKIGPLVEGTLRIGAGMVRVQVPNNLLLGFWVVVVTGQVFWVSI